MAVRSFFAWAEETGQVAENPARSVTLRRLPPTTPSFLTEAEKRRLLKEFRGRSSKLARRDRLIIELFLGTGIRLSRAVQPSRFEKTNIAFNVRQHRNKFMILRFQGFLPTYPLALGEAGQTGAL